MNINEMKVNRLQNQKLFTALGATATDLRCELNVSRGGLAAPSENYHDMSYRLTSHQQNTAT